MPDRHDAFSPLKIGPLTLRNRFVKSATNEGMAKGGLVTKGLAKFHERVAEGGAAMSTVAYCATSPDGRTFVDQAILDDASMNDFRALTDAIHKHGAAACAQVTHAGSFTFLDKDTLKSARPLSASGGFNKTGIASGRFFKKRMNRDEMDAMTNEFVAACVRAKESGFDAVELHMGHGYFLSQFVSKLYNKRRDAYGGDIDKRLNYPSEILQKTLDAVGKDIAVIVKYSMTDGLKGNQIEDGIAIAKRLKAEGAHMAVLSNGMNIESITHMFGSSLPESDARPANVLIALAMWAQRMAAPKNVVFHENYLRDLAVQVRAAVDMPLAYLGGVQSLEGVDLAMEDGFDAIAMGRALIFDPNFVNDLRAGSVTQSGCTACNRCVTMMYSPGGTSCIESRIKPDPKLNKIGAAA